MNRQVTLNRRTILARYRQGNTTWQEVADELGVGLSTLNRFIRESDAPSRSVLVRDSTPAPSLEQKLKAANKALERPSKPKTKPKPKPPNGVNHSLDDVVRQLRAMGVESIEIDLANNRYRCKRTVTGVIDE